LSTALVTGGAGFIGSHLVCTLLARGDQVRVLLQRSGRVRANLLTAEWSEAAGTTLKICGEVSVSILDLAEILSGILSDVPAPEFTPPRAGDINLSQGDPNHAEQVLGFRALVSLVEGLTETVEWIQA
jgi:nucleoside-diphosphate-sugar epimerase